MMTIKYPILGFAPGFYTCSCTFCKKDFMGDKRAVMCETCAINKLNESHDNLLQENYKLKSIIEKIKDIKQYLNDLP